MKSSRYFLFRIVLIGILMVFAACSKQEDIGISHAMMHELAPGQTVGAVYLNLYNNTEKKIVLNSVEAEIADHVEVHRTQYEDGIMSMRPVNHLTVPAGGKFQFKRGGHHLMLMGIGSRMQEGDSFEIKLVFNDGQAVTATAMVKGLR